jgi:hypothetical protein
LPSIPGREPYNKSIRGASGEFLKRPPLKISVEVVG